MTRLQEEQRRIAIREEQKLEGTLIDLPDNLTCSDWSELLLGEDGWLVYGYNQGGFDCVLFKLAPLLSWIKTNHPEIFKSVLPKE